MAEGDYFSFPSSAGPLATDGHDHTPTPESAGGSTKLPQTTPLARDHVSDFRPQALHYPLIPVNEYVKSSTSQQPQKLGQSGVEMPGRARYKEGEDIRVVQHSGTYRNQPRREHSPGDINSVNTPKQPQYGIVNDRNSMSSDISLPSDYSGRSIFSSQSRRSSTAVPRPQSSDDFSSFRLSDLIDNDTIDDTFSKSPKAMKKLGLSTGLFSQAPAVNPPDTALNPEPGKTKYNNVKQPIYKDSGSAKSTTSINSGEDVPVKPDTRRGSFWRNLNPISKEKSPTNNNAPRGGGVLSQRVGRPQKIDILPHPAPSFLASEAQKIATPPISAQPVFPDFKAARPPVPSKLSDSPPHPGMNIPTPREKDVPFCSGEEIRDLWGIGEDEAVVDHAQDVFRSKVATGSEDTGEKYADVPEHLPGSPLCPKHPRYRGKGKRGGICPLHG